jgi:hypothetical protein
MTTIKISAYEFAPVGGRVPMKHDRDQRLPSSDPTDLWVRLPHPNIWPGGIVVFLDFG